MASESVESKKNVVKDYILQIINTGNTQNIDQYIDKNYREIYNGKTYEIGIEGAIEHIKGVHRTYSQLELRIIDQICEGELVATHYSMTGIHSGDWMGIKPTHKKINVYGINLDKVINGKIAEHGGAANLLEPLLEINAISLNKE